MRTLDKTKINQQWPKNGIEQVEHCPYCGSTAREIAYREVQDWSFYCAPGKWTYWDCKQCDTLYLSPRPTADTIGRAYTSYYTHNNQRSVLEMFKERIRNECWSHWYDSDVNPRLRIPTFLMWLLNPFKSRLVEPFGLRELAGLPKGRLMDLGCGNGNMLDLATKLGWQAMGLEIDPVAVITTRNKGLQVLEGSYERLSEYSEVFDCIICFHVLEHVHNPKDILIKIKDTLKIGGVLLLSLPNATSALRYHFGENWRGLEAPRHLSIPSVQGLILFLSEMGFSVKQRKTKRLPTATESSRIQRRANKPNIYDKALEKKLMADKGPITDQQQDFIQLVCLKNQMVQICSTT